MFKTAVTIGAVMVATLAGAEEWTPKQMNKEIEQTNFIIGSHCSATLVDIKERLLLTNHHCIAQYVLKKTRAVTQDDGSITNKQFEVLKPVPTSQKTYRGHDLVGQATYMGEIVGMEEDNDLALVQLRAENIPHTMEAEIFNGTQLYRGETVFAVGNPRGLDLTVSKGVISSTNRLIVVGGKEHSYFQMDARVAPGSSGGSLYNAEGQLIGVPAAASRDGAINLAIPYTDVLELLAEFYEDQEVEEEHTTEEEE